MKNRFGSLAVAAFLVLAGASKSSAQGFTADIFIDEAGFGHLSNSLGFLGAMPSGLTADPGPGGLASVLTYSMLNPPGLVAGDLRLAEFLGGPTGDVIRFNPGQSFSGSVGVLLFYSTIGGGDLADVGFPSSFYANVFDGIEAADGTFLYTPTAGQPGFVAGAAGPVTYHITSDASVVPEPGTLSLMATGLVMPVGGANGRRKRRG